MGGKTSTSIVRFILIKLKEFVSRLCNFIIKVEEDK